MELKIQNLQKDYGTVKALKGVDLTLTEGIYGFLGPNGAGKSTLMNILAGNLNATAGTVTYDGQPITEMGMAYRKKLGYMPQQQSLYPTFTVKRFLSYMAALRGMTKVEAKERIPIVLEQVELTEFADRKIAALSGGMKQRLLIAQAILGDPEILILDEPTAGLDPKQRIIIRNLIASIALHKIVIIATHVVSDVEYIAKEIVLMDQGNIVRACSRSDLVAELQDKVFEVKISEDELPSVTERFKVGNIAKEADGLYVRILSDGPPKGLEAVPMRPALEDVYLWHCGQ